MDLGLLPLRTTEVLQSVILGHTGIFQHERGKTVTDWLSLVPQEHGESEPRGGALLG